MPQTKTGQSVFWTVSNLLTFLLYKMASSYWHGPWFAESLSYFVPRKHSPVLLPVSVRLEGSVEAVQSIGVTRVAQFSFILRLTNFVQIVEVIIEKSQH